MDPSFGLNITARLAGAVSFLVAAIVGRANQPGRTATGCGLAGR